jgi:hypothetical protein
MEDRHVPPALDETDTPGAHAPDDAAANERLAEQQEGISEERRGSEAAPSDQPEGTPPHPQDVTDISR